MLKVQFPLSRTEKKQTNKQTNKKQKTSKQTNVPGYGNHNSERNRQLQYTKWFVHQNRLTMSAEMFFIYFFSVIILQMKQKLKLNFEK